MKTAIYIEDGITQVVLTPETEFEKQALKQIGSSDVSAQIFSGTFYECMGGWTRQSRNYGNSDQQSIILRVGKNPEPEIPKDPGYVAVTHSIERDQYAIDAVEKALAAGRLVPREDLTGGDEK